MAPRVSVGWPCFLWANNVGLSKAQLPERFAVSTGGGEQIEVTTRDGRRARGTLQSADAQQVIFGRPVTVALRRDDVLSIWVMGLEDSLFNGYLLGAIVGLALGGTIHAEDEASMIIPVIATGVGALAGAWVDRSKGPPRRLVYMARDSDLP